MYTTLLTLATCALASALPQVGLPNLNGTVTTANTTGIENCAGQPYYASNYTCYSNQYLCPIVNGVRTQACGIACFDPVYYSCLNGQLEQVVNGTTPYNGTVVANSTVPSPSGAAVARKF